MGVGGRSDLGRERICYVRYKCWRTQEKTDCLGLPSSNKQKILNPVCSGRWACSQELGRAKTSLHRQVSLSLPPPKGRIHIQAAYKFPEESGPRLATRQRGRWGLALSEAQGQRVRAETFSSGDCLGEACGVGPTELQGSCESLTRKGGSEVSVQPGGQ